MTQVQGFDADTEFVDSLLGLVGDSAEPLPGPWDEGWYFVNSGGAVDLYFKAGEVGVVTQVGGSQLLGFPPRDVRSELVELATIIHDSL